MYIYFKMEYKSHCNGEAYMYIIIGQCFYNIALTNILKDKSSAPLKVKINIKSSCGWILFRFSHKMDLYVHNDLTKLHVLILKWT